MMLPNPLHPAVVHFPLVLAFLFPLFAASGFLAIRRGAAARRAWLLPTAFAIAVAGSAWLAVKTGEPVEIDIHRLAKPTEIGRMMRLASCHIRLEIADIIDIELDSLLLQPRSLPSPIAQHILLIPE